MKSASFFTKAAVTVACFLPAMLFSQVSVTATQDTWIWSSSGNTANADTAYGLTANNDLVSIAFGPTYHSYMLFQFDLSAYAGQTVNGNATFSAYVTTLSNDTADRTVSLYALNSAFDELTATYNSVFAGGDPFGATILSFVTNASAGQGIYSYTIPQAVVQTWIDSPSTNYGFAFTESTYNGLFYFSSAESLYGYQSPTLSFDASASAIPEPSTYAALAGALAFGAVVVRRRLQTKAAMGAAQVTA